MSRDRTGSADLQRRVSSRLKRRYLRWLAGQPTAGTCRSSYWRGFWRSYRRSRVVVTVGFCLLAIGAVAAIGLALASLAVLGVLLYGTFFLTPEHHEFADHAQWAAAALTRLALYQTVALPLILLGSTFRIRPEWRRLNRRFYKGRDLIPRLDWRISLAVYAAASLAVSVGATIAQPHGLSAAVASLVATLSLSWMILGLARSLSGTRLPGVLSEPAMQAGIALSVLFLLAPLAVVLYGPAILRVSQYLTLLGPLGWINGSLHQFGQGNFQNLLPFLLVCGLMSYVGRMFEQRARRWAFRRRMLAMYRAGALTKTKDTDSLEKQPPVASDLRAKLSASQRRWRPAFRPRWLRGKLALFLSLWGTLFAIQLALGGCAMLLAHLEQSIGLAEGDAAPEKRMLTGAIGRSVGGAVLFVEVFAVLVRDARRLITFAKRPVSAVGLWIDLQLQGLSSVPLQLVFVLPFLIVPAFLGEECWRAGLLLAGDALLTCVAIRTVACAAACYHAAIASLRPQLLALLQLAGGVVGLLLWFGLLASLAPEVEDRLAVQCAIQAVAVLALGGAYAAWIATSRPRRTLRHAW